MTDPQCTRVSFDDLVVYAAGDEPAVGASELEAHLFACVDCGRRAAELDALIGAIRAVAGRAALGGHMTNAALNQLARDGVRVRMFALSPGDVVPCAVWDRDELLVLRLRADLSPGAAVTLVQSVAGHEVARTTMHVASPLGELLFATPATWVAQLPVIQVDLRLLDDGEHEIARYTLEHGGALTRPAGPQEGQDA